MKSILGKKSHFILNSRELNDVCSEFSLSPSAAMPHQNCALFTARKRSLRRLRFYRCLSVHRGGVSGCSRGGMCGCSWGGGYAWLLPGGMRGCSGGACMVAPWGGGVCGKGGMHGKGGCAWQRGACVVKGGHAWQRGACVAKGGVSGKGGACVAKGGMHGEGGGHAWYARPVIARAVHILLECILLFNNLFLTLTMPGRFHLGSRNDANHDVPIIT